MLLDDLGEVGRVDDESVVAIVEVLARRFRDVHSEEMRGLLQWHLHLPQGVFVRLIGMSASLTLHKQCVVS
eukprot:gene4036-biopygen6699